MFGYDVKRHIGFIIITLAMLGMTCLSSSAFVDATLVPKWISLGIWLLLMVIINGLRILVRPKSLIYQFCDMRFMLIAFIFVAGVNSLWGILQYADALPSGGLFKVTGAFDNPAGLSSTLVVLFPFVLLGMVSKEGLLRQLSQIVFALIFIAVALSGSRAGILCVLLVLILGGHRFITKRSFVKWTFIVAWMILLIVVMFEKADSASGRLLIWNVSWGIVRDNWLWGLGHSGFASEYMNYQAVFLTETANDKWMMLADNIQHPFNEFLLLWINYGIFALVFALLLFVYLVKRYMEDKTPEKQAAFFSIVSIVIFAMVSYPFKYPLVCFVFLYSTVVLVHDAEWVHKVRMIPDILKRLFAVIALIVIIIASVDGYRLIRNEVKWNLAVSSNLFGEEQMLVYDELYPMMQDNRYYLYNYAYALYHVRNYSQASEILKQCRQLWADYDVQILSGLVAMKQKQYDEALNYYDCALKMCPNRFKPLYLKLKTFEECGDVVCVIQCAEQIMDKKIKVPSGEIIKILSYAKNILDSYGLQERV